MTDAQTANEPRATHDLKCWPPFFDAVKRGDKTFEIRRNDRGFQKGDVLRLREYNPAAITGRYSGRCLEAIVLYVLSGWGLEDGFVAMGIGAVREARRV